MCILTNESALKVFPLKCGFDFITDFNKVLKDCPAKSLFFIFYFKVHGMIISTRWKFVGRNWFEKDCGEFCKELSNCVLGGKVVTVLSIKVCSVTSTSTSTNTNTGGDVDAAVELSDWSNCTATASGSSGQSLLTQKFELLKIPSSKNTIFSTKCESTTDTVKARDESVEIFPNMSPPSQNSEESIDTEINNNKNLPGDEQQ